MNNDIIHFPKARVRKAMREKRKQEKEKVRQVLVVNEFEIEVTQFLGHLINDFMKAGLVDDDIIEKPIEPDYTVL